MLEHELERKLIAGVKELGGLCLKWVSPGHAGVPDRIVIVSGRVIFVELKTEEGQLSNLQLAMIQKLRARRADVFVLYGLEDVNLFLKDLRNEIQTA